MLKISTIFYALDYSKGTLLDGVVIIPLCFEFPLHLGDYLTLLFSSLVFK